MKPRIALIHSRIESRQYIPVGLLMLAGFIEPLCDALVFDPDPSDDILADIKRFKPDIIGLSAMTPNYYRAKHILSVLKTEFGEKCLYLIGGIHASIKPLEVFCETQVDAIVMGEGKNALADIIRGKELATIPGVYAGQKTITASTLIADLDSMPLPAYHLMPDFCKYLRPPGTIRGTWQPRGTVALMSGRGCPASCIFCSSHLMFGHRIRRRSVGNVIKEISYLLDNYGKSALFFVDDTFTYQKIWVKEFCEKMKPLNIVWGCQARSDTITDDLVVMMKDAGCRQIDIGIESGSDRILKIINKGETRAQHINALNIVRRNRVRSLATVIIGTPGETAEDVELTKSLIRETRPSTLNVFYMTPFPGTKLYDIAEKRNLWIDKDDSELGIHIRPRIADTLTMEDQIKLRRELYAINRFRNLQGYLTLGFILGFLKTVSLRRIALFAAVFFRKNFHDAMYAYICDYRNFRDG